VTEAQWSDENQKWTVTTESRGKFVANFLINGAGGLHVPKTPDFRGNAANLRLFKLPFNTLLCN
jgi:cation diffusion facilitator CzcD-associated flavoprotein CzcO